MQISKIKNNKLVEKVRANKGEFMEFLKNYNVIQLAIGVVIGNAIKDLISSIANDVIMPIVGLLTPSGLWREMVWRVGGAEFRVGNLLAAVLDFLIVAILVFVVIKKIFKIEINKA